MSTQSHLEQEFSEKKRKRNRLLIIGAIILALAIIAAILIPRLLDSSEDSEGELIPITIADTSQSDFQDAVVEVGRENGLEITFVNFDDPYLPNTALLEGEVDANSFQHIAWLSQFNKENDSDITPMFSTVITSWGLFSSTHESVADFGEGSRIAVPDDAANFSRALFILESAGLIEVDDSAGVFPVEEDITSNPLGIELVRIAHESVQTGYEDPAIDGVVIAVDDFDPALGITPEDALVLEDSSAASSQPYVIVVATTGAQAEDPKWELLEETYRDDRVKAALEEEQRGLATMVEMPVDELRDTLEELTNQ